MGFDYFVNWGNIKVVVYRHTVRCFGYGSEGCWLEAFDGVDIGYFCWAPQLNSIRPDGFGKMYIGK